MLGAGRSGTSLTAGLLRSAGYHMGDRPIPPRRANPRGFFEDLEINRLNETVLASLVPRRPSPRRVGDLLFRHVPPPSLCWIARLPLSTVVRPRPDLAERFRAFTEARPFCYKDPRFCYTLPAWRPYTPPSTRYVLVFRRPTSTAHSLLRDVREQPRYYGDLRIEPEDAYRTWRLQYQHALRHLERDAGRGLADRWLVTHADQLLTPAGQDRLALHTGADVDRSFAEPRLQRSRTEAPVPPSLAALYAALCEQAGWHPAA